MTTDVKPPQSAMGRFMKQTVPEKIPFAGTSGPRAAQQAERQQAVIEAVEEFGGDTGRSLFDESTDAVEKVAKTLGEQRGARLANLKGAKDRVIQNIRAPFTRAPRSVQAIDEQIARLKGIDETEYAPVIERLTRFKENLTSGKTLEQVEGQRKLLGDLFADPNLAKIKGEGQKAINAIYDPLRQDMGEFIARTAGEGARNRWARANQELSAMAGELQSAAFKNVLRQTDVTPEAVGRILFANGDNVSDMKRLVANLDESGRKKVQAALIQRAFDKAGGAEGVSVERFLGNLDGLSKKIGVAFQGEDKAALDGLYRLLDATRRGGKATAEVRTGEQTLPTVMGIGATQALGVVGGVGTLGVGGLMARVYESAPVRNLVVRLGKTKPGTPAEARTLDAVMKASAPIVANWQREAQAIAASANDNIAAPLAAEPTEPGSQ